MRRDLPQPVLYAIYDAVSSAERRERYPGMIVVHPSVYPRFWNWRGLRGLGLKLRSDFDLDPHVFRLRDEWGFISDTAIPL